MNCQIAYLYHLPLKSPLQLGRYTLWPYRKLATKRIKSPHIRKYLDRLFRQMLDYRGKPLRHIAVLSGDSSSEFPPMLETIHNEMRDVLGSLFLSAVIRNNSLLGDAVSSENFHLVIQNFQPGSNGCVTSDGSYIRTKVISSKLRDAGIHLPGFVPQPERLYFDETLLQGCLQCFSDPRPTLKSRIAPSIRWVAHAYTNVEHFSYYNRILLLMIAFEILADQPDSLKQDSFGAWLDSVWGTSKQNKFHLQQTSWASGKGPFGKVGWWGVEYYRFRSAIIHKGDPNNLKTHDHVGREFFATGVQIFAECVKDLLRQENFMPTLTFSEKLIRAGHLTSRP